MNAAEKKLKRIFIAIAGGTVLLTGLVLIFLPGPGLIFILAGLAILATEFVWARRLLSKAKDKLNDDQNSPRSGDA